jgi:hypothetical protein
MIRQMKRGEQDKVRELIARLEYEDQSFQRKQAKPFSEYMKKRSSVPVRRKIAGRTLSLSRRKVARSWGCIG